MIRKALTPNSKKAIEKALFLMKKKKALFLMKKKKKKNTKSFLEVPSLGYSFSMRILRHF